MDTDKHRFGKKGQSQMLENVSWKKPNDLAFLFFYLCSSVFICGFNFFLK